MMDATYMLTTFDNPYDPFEQFTLWFMYDTTNGYNSCGKIARIAKVEDDFTEKETFEEIERAIDEIIKYDFMNIYKKVAKPVANPESETSDDADDDGEDEEIK